MFADLQNLSSLLGAEKGPQQDKPLQTFKQTAVSSQARHPQPQTRSKDIWDDLEVEEEEEQQEAAHDPRPTAEYEMHHRQNLASQDIFLGGMTGGRTNSIADADEIVVTIQLPGVDRSELVTLDCQESRLSLRCPLWKLDLDLGYSVDEAKGDAQWQTGVLKVILPIKR